MELFLTEELGNKTKSENEVGQKDVVLKTKRIATVVGHFVGM